MLKGSLGFQTPVTTRGIAEAIQYCASMSSFLRVHMVALHVKDLQFKVQT